MTWELAPAVAFLGPFVAFPASRAFRRFRP